MKSNAIFRYVFIKKKLLSKYISFEVRNALINRIYSCDWQILIYIRDISQLGTILGM